MFVSKQPQLSASCCLVLLSAAFLAAFAPILSEAGNIKRPFKAAEQEKLNTKGDLAIANVQSEMKREDIDRVLRFKKAVFNRAEPNDCAKLQFEVPRFPLVQGLARVMRHQLGAYYLGQKAIDQQLFEETLEEKFVAPCKQLDSILGGWWRAASEGLYAKDNQRRLDMLVAESVCRELIKLMAVEDNQLVGSIRREFDYSLDKDVVQTLKYGSQETSERVQAIRDSGVDSLQLAQLIFLRKCIVLKTYDYGERFARIPDMDFVKGLAAFVVLDSSEQQGGGDKDLDRTNVEQTIREKFVKPCEVIHAQFNKVENVDAAWKRVESVCNTFDDINALYGLKKLTEKVHEEMDRQIQAGRANPNRQVDENLRLLFI